MRWAKTWHISYTQDFEYKIYIAKRQNKVIYITSGAVVKIKFESTGKIAFWYMQVGTWLTCFLCIVPNLLQVLNSSLKIHMELLIQYILTANQQDKRH